MTADNAELYGLDDRGRVAVGKKADLNVIDFEGLALRSPEFVRDLPAHAGRLVQDADGYRATIVAGEVIRRDGVDTGARPGQLVRSGAWRPTRSTTSTAGPSPGTSPVPRCASP